MKLFKALMCCMALLLCSGVQAQAPQPLQSVASLDVQRYLGRWYEIAKFPNRFQRQCVADTSAEYSERTDGRLQVLNQCRLQSGDMERAIGVARVIGAPDSAKLKVRFAPAWLSVLPWVWGDYWVVDIDEGYGLVAVSEPQREYLWILARTPQVDTARYTSLLGRLRAMGLEVDKLVPTAHAPSGAGAVPVAR